MILPIRKVFTTINLDRLNKKVRILGQQPTETVSGTVKVHNL